MTPEQARLRARRGAYSLHARYDGLEITAGARAAFLRRFEREVDPNLVLPAEERQRRAVYARKAYMTGLALASSRARAIGRLNRRASTVPVPVGSRQEPAAALGSIALRRGEGAE
jgi:hypothetical protein